MNELAQATRPGRAGKSPPHGQTAEGASAPIRSVRKSGDLDGTNPLAPQHRDRCRRPVSNRHQRLMSPGPGMTRAGIDLHRSGCKIC